MKKKFVWVAILLSGQCLVVAPLGAQNQNPAPALSITAANNGISLSWPASASGFVLETATALGTNTAWLRLKNGITMSGTNFVLSQPASALQSFYRLHNIGEPITAPEQVWTFVPFSDAFCMEGDTIGIGVNLTTNSHRALIFLNGGGACWDELTCYTLNTATHGPFGPAQFAALVPNLSRAWIFDRSSTANPFKDYSFVFIPYCTGDVHAGSHIAQYGAHTNRHVGYQNITAFLRRLVPTFVSADRIILAGASSGGHGAVINWRQTQEAFGHTRVDLIDDSGPFLSLSSPAGLFGSASRTNWNLDAAMPPECDSCSSNLPSLFDYYAGTYPNGRGAFLSFDSDQPFAANYGISQAQFTVALNEFVQNRIAPHANYRSFIAAGSDHTFLTATSPVAVNGVSVAQFLGQMLADDPSWTSVNP